MGATNEPMPGVVKDARAVHARVVELVAEAEKASTVAEARGAILALARLLPAHFRDEEQAVFAEVLQVRPELGGAVAKFAGQHVELAERMRDLALQMPDDGVVLPAAATAIPDVLRQLREHERTESELLFDVWQGGDGGAPD